MSYTSKQIQQFWSKVNILGEDECWNWKLSVDKYGYGKLKLDSQSRNAHRVAFEICYGEVTGLISVQHICESKLCCNPKHLYARVEKYQYSEDETSISSRLRSLLSGRLSSTPLDSPTPSTHSPV